jgi:small subunit ribosomal protein S6
MTLPAPTYDLMLLLDVQVESDVRAKIVADTRATVEAQGELLRHDEWGERALTYPIEKKTNAEYHLLQFHAGTPQLLSDLDRTLRITDGLLRFRIVKLAPGVPDAPDMRSAPRATAESPASSAAEPVAAGEPTTEPEPEPSEAAPADAAAELAPETVADPA